MARIKITAAKRGKYEINYVDRERVLSPLPASASARITRRPSAPPPARLPQARPPLGAAVRAAAKAQEPVPREGGGEASSSRSRCRGRAQVTLPGVKCHRPREAPPTKSLLEPGAGRGAHTSEAPSAMTAVTTKRVFTGGPPRAPRRSSLPLVSVPPSPSHHPCPSLPLPSPGGGAWGQQCALGDQTRDGCPRPRPLPGCVASSEADGAPTLTLSPVFKTRLLDSHVLPGPASSRARREERFTSRS